MTLFISWVSKSINALSFSIRSFNAFISTLSPIIFVLLKFDAICLKKQSASVNIWLNKWKYEAKVFEEVKLTIPLSMNV